MNRLLAGVVWSAAAIGAVATPALARGQSITPALAIATFDTAWARIDRTYYDTTFLNTRWKVLRDSLRPIAQQATTNNELRVVLQRLIGGVGVSHFGLIPQEMSPVLSDRSAAARGGTAASGGTGSGPPVPGGALSASGNIGASLRAIGNDVVVWKVDAAGAARAAGIKPGDVVLSIDGFDIADAFAQLAQIADESVARQARIAAVSRANSQLGGRVDDTVRVQIKSGSETRTLALARTIVRGDMVRVGNLPALNAYVDVTERRADASNPPKRVGVVAFSVWLPQLSARLDSIFDHLRDMDGLIIDLRGNPGGFAGMVSSVAGQVVDSSYVLGRLRQRNVTLHLAANPRARPFAGPVAVIIDRMSGSTSEFFAAGLQSIGRARVFGDTSAGAALPAILDRLPNGDVMMHATADLVDAKGRRVEGVGVIPDEPIALTIAGLAAGRDDAMAAALKWIAAQKAPNKGSR